ncbi:hypothetical protein [Pseudomonas sp. RC10]|uniref:hypothetical protein n=1 Tax=Pseudomonas bambusae TaxID=3139142 RepID=UPI003138D537
MKERPILFSAPMVRAIVDGSKTVTRREVKKRAALDCLAAGFEPAFLTLSGNADLCPYGQPGDRLWVRETWAEVGIAQADPDKKWFVYRECDNLTDYGGPWKPSIFMPRRACRILLEITAVRVERLQDITQEQAELEGVACDMSAWTFRDHFQQLWEAINGAGAWNANPWVWAVEFKRVKP